MTRTAALFEIIFVVDDERVAEVDAWVSEIVGAAVRKEGIEDARAFETGGVAEGKAGRTCQFQVSNDRSLTALLDGYFSDINAEATIKFGDQIQVTERTLHVDEPLDLPADESPVCLNCGTRLRGQYCGRCGQRSRSRLISIWQLVREAFGDLLELDSRLWQTLLPLLVRPGKLTRDYLEGRRARYMPPFRTYLVLSVLFFVVAFFDPQEDLSLFLEPEAPPTAEEREQSEDAAAASEATREQRRAEAVEKLEQLKEDGVPVPAGVMEEVIDDDDEFSISINSGGSSSGFFENCDQATIGDDDDLPEWVKKRFTNERMKDICERNQARGVDNFADAIVDNIPIALIVLLPVLAMVLKVLYPLSRRYFVEHLLFFVHFHAFFFLILTLLVLLAQLGAFLGSPDGAIEGIATLTIVIASFYIPVYLYKAMRHVYGQGHLATIPKYFLLLAAYLTGAIITMALVLLAAALSA